MFFTCASAVCQHNYLWITLAVIETPAKMGFQVARSTLRLCGGGVCERDGVWQCWVLIPLLLLQLVLVPALHSWGQGELFARKQWQRKECRACLCLVDLLILPYLANTTMTVSVIAALVFYSNLIIALFWASEERWEVKVLRNRKSYRNHISLPFWLLFLLSQKIAEWLGCLLCKISSFKS